MARTRPPRDRAQLHRLAAPLQPEQPPFYVAAPERPGQLAGWYWVPPGGAEPVPLGSNVYMAAAAIVAYSQQAA